MKDKKRKTQLFTTHCHPGKRPKLIGQPMIINGKRSLAYVKNERVESYIFWEEAQEKIFDPEIPRFTVGF